MGKKQQQIKWIRADRLIGKKQKRKHTELTKKECITSHENKPRQTFLTQKNIVA